MVWLKQVFLPARIPGVEFEQMQGLQDVNREEWRDPEEDEVGN